MKMEEWKECKLGEIAHFTTGKLNSNAAEDNGLYPFFTCSPETYRINSYAFDTNAILLAGNNAEGNFNIKRYSGKFNAYQRTYVITVDDNTDLNFLFYALKLCLADFKHISQGTATKFLTAQILNNFVIRLPPLPTQSKIADILSSLDDKIELNNKINTNLEQQAQALFKNWFVDFEPFGGKMPDGWKEGTVSEIIELHDSKRIPLSSQQRENMEKIYPYYGATSLMDYVDDYLFDGIYLLFGEDGTVIDSDGFPILQYVEGKFWVNNHAHILTGKNGFSVEMLYLLFSLTNVQDKVTGAVQPKISQGNLNSIKAIIPDSQVCKEFDSIIQPLFSQIRDLKSENTNLSTIRNTLLPKLMSGELDGFIL